MATTRTDLRSSVERDETAPAELVGPDPHRPGPQSFRLLAAGIPVWAIVQHLHGIDGDTDPAESSPEAIAETAGDYRITPAEVVAALRYYAENRGAVDAKIAANAAAASRP
jgi:uncharacterized protein (DUF433 family)